MPTTATAPAARYLASQPTSQPWVIIPCSGSKLDRPAPADELYTGSMFKLTLRAALSITSPERVRVLSGLYGLVSLYAKIGPYEQRIDQPGGITASRVRQQLSAASITGPIVSLLPKPYLRVLTIAHTGTPADLVNLYEGCRGIGDQRAALAYLIRASAR